MRNRFGMGLLVGVGAYWAIQHFTGYGKSGSRGPYNG